MKTIILYKFDAEDPSLQFVNDAINRLISFIEYDEATKTFAKGKDGVSLKAYARVMVANEFNEQDLRELTDFLITLGGRATARYSQVDMADAPWKDATIQSANNAIAAADQLRKMFYDRCPNIKTIAGPAVT